MYSLIRPLLFKLEPETAHQVALSGLHYLPSWCISKPRGKSVDALGMRFPHAVGLAAGLDKNGEHLDALSKLGFSYIEIGTVTPKPQSGNPKPRLFRLPEAGAIINRMGFNNHGVDALVKNIEQANYQGILGINIGKNKDTPLAKANEDYLHCLRKVYPYASYVTINISSPNTPELRQLQQGDHLSNLLSALKVEQAKLAEQYQRYVPLVVKVSPDEEVETIKHMADLIISFGIEGIIATNTTCARDMVKNSPLANEAGGLSGKPLAELSTQCLRLLKSIVGDEVCLIGVGGIDSATVAQEKLNAGASLLQVYTGLIYRGPGLINELVQGISHVGD